MKTLRELIAQLPPDSQKRIEEMTRKLIEEEAAARKARETEAIESRDTSAAPYSFFHVARNMNLDGPPDWSTRLDDYL